ncbi:unnamed protein product [Rotaria socialis]
MYPHLSIAMEQAQKRLKQRQQQTNIRRRRRHHTTQIEICSATTDDAAMINCDEQDQTELSNLKETIDQPITDPYEILDFDTDFDVGTFIENMSDAEPEVNIDCEFSTDDQYEPLTLEDLFPPNNNENNNFLHPYTNIKTNDFCRQLAKVFRDANISNVHCIRILKLISSILPQPHQSPTTLKALYSSMNVEQLFNKRSVCTECSTNLSNNDRSCNNCKSINKKSIASIYDVNQMVVFARTLDRLSVDIENSRRDIIDNNLSGGSNKNNDTMFNQVYKELKDNYGLSSFVSLLLHLDGISLCIPTRSGINYKILIYGITGDCPAIKLAIKHVNHQGYWCCWFCYIHGVHIHHKRQYYFKKELALRSAAEYALYSHEAEETKTNIYGHLGVSPLSVIIDVPLPRCLVIDYMHVSLLRHTRTVIQYIYGNFLKPKQREELDELFRNQPFPHFFNRKMRPVKEFSYCKATELRNMLLYGLLPLIRLFLPIECAAHLALYVTAMRLFHGPRTIGNDTETVANELMTMYYKHHTLFYENIQNFVLHLHSHFMDQYRLHGSLSNLGTFGQESLIGHFANNRNGTRNLGQLIINNYNVDFTIVNQLHHHLSDVPVKSNGLFDSHDALINNFLLKTHNDLCFCDNANQCIRIYRRHRIDAMIYHSLIYHRRGSSKSYFVQYSKDNDKNLFGEIELFFTCNNKNYALIHNHSSKHLFTDYFLSSKYHSILLKALNMYFYVLNLTSTCRDVITVDNISNMCIVFTFCDSLVVTPLSCSYEHD